MTHPTKAQIAELRDEIMAADWSGPLGWKVPIVAAWLYCARAAR